MSSGTMTVLGTQLRNIQRSRWAFGYAAAFLLLSEAIVRLSAESGPGILLAVVTVVLAVVPLASLVLGAMHVYSMREFTELLLAQPLTRTAVFGGMYLGVALPLALAPLAGIGISLLLHGQLAPGTWRSLALLALGTVLLTFTCTAIAFLIATAVRDRARGLGTVLLVWLLLFVLYDGLVLLVALLFTDYPLELPMLVLLLLNPVDLARSLMLLELDAPALLGYTGAVFRRAFGSGMAIPAGLSILVLWSLVPLLAAIRVFRRRDF